jgi:hypothetical protein
MSLKNRLRDFFQRGGGQEVKQLVEPTGNVKIVEYEDGSTAILPADEET